jgi:XTP/dITP diphosphohydrolase/tetrapyrrole methylase family protein/MazG family protein
MPHPLLDPAFAPDDALRDALADFVTLVRHLRRDCPWDARQTHDSVKHLTVEETYEAVDAIEAEDWQGLSEELGDLFLHVVFHATIAESDAQASGEAPRFTLEQVVRQETAKLIRRHPHVFGDTAIAGEADVLRNWEAIKAAEGEGKPKGLLSGVPRALPALLRAYRMQDKAAGVGFDFADGDDAWTKVEEELREFRAEPTQDELGDVLFSVVNYARKRGLEPETALQQTNAKFAGRFAFIEAELARQGRTPSDADLDELDALWDQAKQHQRTDRP